MNRLNWEIIKGNIEEARKQLQDVVTLIEKGEYPYKEELQIMMQHAYHHINFAWNAKNIAIKRYNNLTIADFNTFGKFPKDIKAIHVSKPIKKSRVVRNKK